MNKNTTIQYPEGLVTSKAHLLSKGSRTAGHLSCCTFSSTSAQYLKCNCPKAFISITNIIKSELHLG